MHCLSPEAGGLSSTTVHTKVVCSSAPPPLQNPPSILSSCVVTCGNVRRSRIYIDIYELLWTSLKTKKLDVVKSEAPRHLGNIWMSRLQLQFQRILFRPTKIRILFGSWQMYLINRRLHTLRFILLSQCVFEQEEQSRLARYAPSLTVSVTLAAKFCLLHGS